MGWFIVQIVLIVMSTAYQVVQAKKARKKAKAAAEARKALKYLLKERGVIFPLYMDALKLVVTVFFMKPRKVINFLSQLQQIM